MSWDILVVGLSTPPPRVEQMPRDWRGEALGSPVEVREKISAVLPEVDWSDPTWGILVRDGFSFEFNVGGKHPSDGFMVHVRGGPAVAQLLRLAEKTGWYLLDLSQMEWLHHCKDPEAGWVGFQAYRDRAISAMQKRAEPGTGDERRN
jgi:hypothetical protein